MRVLSQTNWKVIGNRMRRAMWGILLVAAMTPGCRVDGQAVPVTLELTSPSFQNGASIPAKFTCSGASISPQLSWSAPPAGTKALALVVTDPDAPSGTFTHWLLYNISAGTRGLAENLPKQGQLGDGSLQGRNQHEEIGYAGPCPPNHQQHRYFFRLYALDAKLSLTPGAERSEVEAVMKGHILGRGELVGLYRQ
ncbi:MAG: YbhB/YbcL family Raf kinase inhibitor-like protein [Terracidiphilus sp.]|jgi:Raf kinase inhibitor-like YbhB/YbcL family protein